MIGNNSIVYPILLSIVAPDPMYETVVLEDEDERNEVYERFHNRTEETTWNNIFECVKDKEKANKLIDLLNELDHQEQS